MRNSFGSFFKITTFGESHGQGLGAVIDGCPAGIHFDYNLLESELLRRRPGSDKQVTSDRQEVDQPIVLSGVFEGKTLGTPITIIVNNSDARSKDYSAQQVRVGHADDMWQEKFGHRDYRGGGRSSGRETVARVMGGVVAQMYLNHVQLNIAVTAAVIQIGPLRLQISDKDYLNLNSAEIQKEVTESLTHFPDAELNQQATLLLKEAKNAGRSYGGELAILASGVPVGLGQPVFGKLKADIAHAILGIGSVYSIEFGTPYDLAQVEGSEFHVDHEASQYGGIRGGISTGEPILIRVKIKPTASVKDIAKQGRHDPCIAPRVAVVMENMVKLVIVDHLLQAKLDRA